MRIETLRSLANATDSDCIVIMVAPNVLFIAKVDANQYDTIIAYRWTTNEYKILAPIDAKENLSISLQGRCNIVYYSFNLHEKEGYVIGRDFEKILIVFEIFYRT
ncbi:MAG: hypothetical protein QW101_04670 [Ignisphaera sp.]|uniref:Uncharacterized protein n=1 Tax=Ignisphaera aggregans TaxID=334771 RepID=A0A7J3MX82_9CREN